MSVASQTTVYYKGVAAREEMPCVKALCLVVQGVGQVIGAV